MRADCLLSGTASVTVSHRLTKGVQALPLLHINMAVMTVACLLLLVGFSWREYVWGPGMMLLGSLTIMGLIIYDIRILSAMS